MLKKTDIHFVINKLIVISQTFFDIMAKKYDKEFHIEKLDNKRILVIPTNYLRPEQYLEQIEYVIASNFTGCSTVYFDFLIKNGKRDRYYKAQVTDNRIQVNSFCPIVIDSELMLLSNSFFSKHFELISESLLPKAQKFMLQKEFFA